MRPTLLALLLLAPLVLAQGITEPPSSSVGLPHQGDRFAYQHEGVMTTLVWNGTMDFWDEWGRPITLDLLEVHQANGDAARVGYRGGEDAPRTYERQGGSGKAGSGGGGDAFLWGDNRSTIEVQGGSIWYQMSQPAGRACLERSGWQGMRFDDIVNDSPSRLCPFIAADSLRVNGTEVVHGYAAERIEFLSHDHPISAMWLAADLPYPLAWSDCRGRYGDPDPCGSAGLAPVQLVGYEPGTHALLPPAPPMPPGTPEPNDFQDSSQSGVPDHGFSEFPAEDALAAIAQDTSLSRHRDFESAHPDAPIVWATHLLDLNDPNASDPIETWQFEWATQDGPASSVGSVEDGNCTIAGVKPGPQLPPGAVPRSLEQCKPANRENSAAVCRDCAPTMLPTRTMSFGAAVKRFQAERLEPNEPLWIYSYQVRRGPEGGVEGTIEVTAAVVGSKTQPNSPLQQTGGSGAISGEGITIDALTGRTVGHAFVSSTNVTWTRSPGLITGLAGQQSATGRSEPATMATLAQPQPVATPSFADERSATIITAVAAAGGASLLALLILLYSRIRRRDAPTHPRRAAILRALESRAGLSLKELAETTSIRGGALRHHVRVLVQTGHLARIESAGVTRHFLAGSADHARLVMEAVLLSDGAEARVLRLLRERPGAHAALLARELRVSRPAVHYAVRRLERRGLVEARRGAQGDGRRARLYVKA